MDIYIGLFLKYAEFFVSLFCGIILAVRFSKMRWRHWMAKAALVLSIFIVIRPVWLRGINCKYAIENYDAMAFCLVIVMLTFFKCNFWEVFSRSCIYWINVKFVHIYIIYVCSMMQGISFYDYNVTYKYLQSGQNNAWPWHNVHLLAVFALVTASVVLCIVHNKWNIMRLQGRKSYIISVLVIIEAAVIYGMLPDYEIYNIASAEWFLVMSLFMMIVIMFVVFYAVVEAYFSSKQHEKLAQLNYQLMCQQYNNLVNVYEARRYQIHDAIQHNILISGFLEEKQYQEAADYIRNLLKTQKSLLKVRYTGILEIDFLINYKLEKVADKKIIFDVNADVLFCPISKEDMCVMLGNLIDNAIEATECLCQEKRWIKIDLKTKNDIFLLGIRNPYEGKIKISDGMYVSTKRDSRFHGLGLKSVQLLVNKYDGDLEIRDNEQIFQVDITIFKKCGK